MSPIVPKRGGPVTTPRNRRAQTCAEHCVARLEDLSVSKRARALIISPRRCFVRTWLRLWRRWLWSL